MKSALAYFVLILFPVVIADKYSYIVWNKNSMEIYSTAYRKDIPKFSLVHAVYENKINQTGWAFLELHTSPAYSDKKQAFAAGYIEGYLTRDLIWMHWQNMIKNYCVGKTAICNLIEEYVDKNEKYLSEMVEKYPDDPYWYQLALYFLQVEGVAIGYRDATSDPTHTLSTRDIIWINMLGDLDDLSIALSGAEPKADGRLFGADHCSGLVKLLPDRTDLFTSQVTWNSYQSMLRIQKKYVMHLRESPKSKKLIPGHTMSFSSYPAFVQSTDDFYIISSGLVPAETTIGNSNRSLFNLVKPRGSVMEYARAMLANRLANTGAEWTSIFKLHNSGTYNNQWYIVDYKQFKPATENTEAQIKPGLLWVAEQLPGYIRAEDLTDLLLETTYFPSYNLPYFTDVFNMSGGQARIELWGDWFGYDTNPRAFMFKEKHNGINNLQDMYNVLRYNDYKHDPLARCEQCSPPYSACNAISARNDLNPANGTYPFRALGHRSHGGTDVKVTSVEMMQTYRFLSVSSPTYNISRGVPPFQWSKTDFVGISHVGHPDLWMFKPLIHDWEWR